MANQPKESFPMLPPKSWWSLRKRFQQTVPAAVTPSYLSPVLGITEGSAQNNVLPYLKTMGLIDQDGKPTDLANKWRMDDTYSNVCEKIIKKIYPQEVLDAFPEPSKNRAALESWFASKTGSGQVAARRMATLFVMLKESDLTKGEQVKAANPKEKKQTTVKNAAKKQPPKIEKLDEPSQKEQQVQNLSSSLSFPSIHIDLQIHLSPEAKLDQIDQLFSSMAKHLKDLFPNYSKIK